MKEVKFNPFGSITNEYAYNAVRRPKEKKKIRWGIVLSIFFVLSLVVAYAALFFTAVQMQEDTDQKIDDFNASLASVHDTFSDPKLPQELRDTADKAEETAGRETKDIKATRLISNVVGHLEDSAPQFDKHGDKGEEALKVAPYYAICDLAAYSINTSSIDHKGLCEDFSHVAQDMMGAIRQYNSISNGVIGVVTFHTDVYTDILSSNEELVENLPDDPKPAQPEPGEAPPQQENKEEDR